MKKLRVSEYLSSREISKLDFLTLVAITLQGMYVDVFELGQIRWDHVLYEEYCQLEDDPRLRKVSLITFILFAYYCGGAPDAPMAEMKSVSELYNIEPPTEEEINNIREMRDDILEIISTSNRAFSTLGYGERYRNVLLNLLESELLNAQTFGLPV